MSTCHIYSNRHISKQIANIKENDTIVLENALSKKRWQLYFKVNNIVEQNLNIKYIRIEDFMSIEKVNFDAVVGNPPYNIGAVQHKYIDFIKKAFEFNPNSASFVIPIAWTYSSRFTNFLEFLIENGLESVEFLTRDEFPAIEQDVCKIFLTRGYNGKISVTNTSKLITEFDRNTNTLLPASNETVKSILTKIKKFKGMKLSTADNPTIRHHGEKIFDDYINDVKTDKHNIKMLSRLGGSIDKNEILWVSKATGINSKYKIATARLQPAKGKISYWQIIEPNIAISEALVFIEVDTKETAENCLDFLNSSLVKLIFKEYMQTARMSKGLVEKIPAFKFDKKITNQEVYRQINLTEKEIEYIESNY